MKQLHVSVHFEYADHIEALLDEHEVDHYVVVPRAEGRDTEGHHDGSQVFPGTITLIVARIPDERVGTILEALREFRDAKHAHHHLEAAIVPIERTL